MDEREVIMKLAKSSNVKSRDVKRDYFEAIALAVVLVTVVSVMKFRGGTVNYYNSDATWHALLTIEAYDETPKSQHLFLPIVSLGNSGDKWIPWGATIPDDLGNYYYTSFSPAAYFCAWLFIKIFCLPVSENSLYLFNSLLFTVSAAIWGWLISLVYEKSLYKRTLVSIAILTYVLAPELMHGMGIVFWAQSVMQVTLLMQICAYYLYMKYDFKAGKIIFFILAFINPYIEWTGYVANIGFAVVELVLHWKKNKKTAVVHACSIGVLTVCSFVAFVMHFLFRVDANVFFRTLYARFCARNVSVSVPLVSLFSGYLKSFLWLWVLLLMLAVWSFIKNKKIELRHGIFAVLIAFPLLENMLMKQHAVMYSFDRMKFIFLISFCICELASNLLESYDRKKVRTKMSIITMVLGFGFLNLKAYMGDSTLIWDIDYINENEIIADYINENYKDSVLAFENESVRGYINMLFMRGIYESIDFNTAMEKALSLGKRYVIMLNIENIGSWSMYDLSGATIYDTQTRETSILLVENGAVSTCADYSSSWFVWKKYEKESHL